MIQLDFFESDALTDLKDDFSKLRASTDKVRKGIYARHGELQKKYDDLVRRIDILEKVICKGDNAKLYTQS